MQDKRLFRFLFLSMAEGIAVGWALLLFLVWSDAGGFGTLIHASNHPNLAMFMLAGMFAITFGSAGMGVAMLGMGEESDDDMPRKDGADES